MPTRFINIRGTECVPLQIIRACSRLNEKASLAFKKVTEFLRGFFSLKMVARIRTALAELIYIPGISYLMLLEEGLSLSPLDFDQIYNTCLSA